MDVKININLNEKCRVRLTNLGRKALLEHWQYLPTISEQEAAKSADICNPGWREGEVSFQVWELMQIFGPHLHMEGDVLFERNEIILEVPDAAQS